MTENKIPFQSEMYGIMEWIRCPVCKSKTRLRIREDSILINFPLYCPKCKKESLIEVKKFQVDVLKEPDAQTQSR